MVSVKDMRKISEFEWEIPKEFRRDMRVPARVFATRRMLDKITQDRSLQQLVNVTTLPGIVGYAVCMPDVHEGYGFPIGCVAAFDIENGIVSPGGIGYDINCGVRLLISPLPLKEVQPHIERLAQLIYERVPAGVGESGPLTLSEKELDRVLEEGVRWAVEKGFGKPEDLQSIESEGCLPGADASAVSKTAKQRGHDQLGTMGAGNHFVEVQYADQIYDRETAEKLGLFEGQVVILIHTGSRGLGHQVATDYIKLMLQNLKKWGIDLPDRELACAPLNEPEAQRYLSAMNAAANFAFTNRQLITHWIRKAWKEVFGNAHLQILYDVAHNIAKVEEYEVNGKKAKVLVHRKGATRAFPPHSPHLAPKYRETGQPVLIPGSMGTASYVLLGTQGSIEKAFGSTCHGAGRQLSRARARKMVSADELVSQLGKKGILVKAHSKKGVAEEAPIAYKDVDSVVDVVHHVGIAHKLARLRPLAVIKG